MGKPLRIEVLGGGIAAATIALLLAQAGASVVSGRAAPRRERIVAVPRSTVELIEHLTGIAVADAVPSRQVTSRCVAWEDRRSSLLPNDALVLDAEALAGAIAQAVPVSGGAEAVPQGIAPDWTVIASGRSAGASRMTGGARQATAGWAPVVPGFGDCTTLLVCVPQGWLFACPHPVVGVSVMLVYPAPCLEMAPAEVLAQAVDFVWPGVGSTVQCRTGCAVPAMPSFEPGCAVPGRIAVGEAAITFDPVCGDGVGHAVRGALLASTVILGIHDGAELGEYLAHYRSRLAHAFAGHVRTAAAHYATAWNSPVWRDDMAAMAACAAAMATPDQLNYRLHGRKLLVV